MFLSTAHTEKDIRSFIDCIKSSTLKLIKENYFVLGEKKIKESFETLPMITPQDRFFKIAKSEDKFERLSAQIALGIEFIGEFNEEHFKKAFSEIVDRYESFHARYDLEGKKIEFGKKNTYSIGNLDLSSLSDPEKSLHDWFLENSKTELDPSTDPLKVDIINHTKNRLPL